MVPLTVAMNSSLPFFCDWVGASADTLWRNWLWQSRIHEYLLQLLLHF